MAGALKFQELCWLAVDLAVFAEYGDADHLAGRPPPPAKSSPAPAPQTAGSSRRKRIRFIEPPSGGVPP